jgi:hypothetical protein
VCFTYFRAVLSPNVLELLNDVISDFGLHGGLQFGFRDGGRVIVPVLLEFTGFYSGCFIFVFWEV